MRVRRPPMMRPRVPRRHWASRGEPSLVFGPAEVVEGQTVVTVEEQGARGFRPLGVITIDDGGANYHPVPDRRRVLFVVGFAALALLALVAPLWRRARA